MQRKPAWGSWTELLRFISVLRLFLGIFWSFYLLKFKKYWHSAKWVEERKQILFETEARRFRETAVEMGGLLIKLGQFFSTRVDILPPSVTRELALLQDDVQPESFEAVRVVVEDELGQPLDQLFVEFKEKPLASASLGQVHVGRLKDGRKVAVKVMRPGIERKVQIDLHALHRVISLVRWLTDIDRYIDIETIYRELKDMVWQELDYINEGRNAEKLAENCRERTIPIIPAIHWEYTTRRVLTMDHMEGIKITDYEELEKQGINRTLVARQLVQTYVYQILVDGFFHADPHPGNLFVSNDGRLIMVDFGMVGAIQPGLRKDLESMATAAVKRDYRKVVDYLKHMGFLRRDADGEKIARTMAVMVENFFGSKDLISDHDLMDILDDIEQLIYEQPFQIPAQFTFLGRAAGTIYGLCLGLDPDFNFLDELKPFLKQLTGRLGLGFWSDLLQKGSALAGAFFDVPPLAKNFLMKAERGELVVNVPLTPVQDALVQNTRAINSLAWALTFGFSIATSAYLLVNGMDLEARIGFGFAALVFVILLRSTRQSKRKNRPHPPIITRH